MPVSKCKCGRLFQTERGLKIHMAKLKCEGEVEKQRSDATVHSGKTPNDTGPVSHHSSECVRVSGLTENPPRESSSLAVMIGMGRTDWMTISNVILRKF